MSVFSPIKRDPELTHEAMYPESKRFSPEKQSQRRKQEPSEIISHGFTTDTANKTGFSSRTIQQKRIRNYVSFAHYRYFFDTVNVSFVSFARLYRYFNDVVSWISLPLFPHGIVTLVTR